jgi:penicillin-binding protein 1A
MMQSVVEEGTARAAKVLEREIAGKTGTTNGSRSVWFGGIIPDLATVIYVGYDDNKTLGRASGSSVPLPIWIEYMKPLLPKIPASTFVRPETIETAQIDPESGKLAVAGNERWIDEVFLPGTVPTEYASAGTGDIYADDEPYEEDGAGGSGNEQAPYMLPDDE